MASTNKTSNYELSQFVGSDKPAWLSDYNGDMSKIDTGIHNAQTTATGADGKADANTTNIGELTYLSTTAKTNLVAAINEVDSNADTAQGTANTASSNANSALTKVTALEQKFDLNTVSDLNLTTSYGSIASHNMKIAKNSDGSLAKVYGRITWNNSSYAGDVTITMTNTGLGAIDEEFSVACAGIRTIYAGGINSTAPCTLTYKTNGNITFTFYASAVTTNIEAIFIPFITILKSFGDSPE